MSTAPAAVLDQAHRPVQGARLLPADEAAAVLEQVATIAQAAQAAQAEVLAGAERSGDLAESGCRTARSFAATILRRSAADATALAQVALKQKGNHMSPTGKSTWKRYLFTWDWVPGPWWVRLVVCVAVFALAVMFFNVVDAQAAPDRPGATLTQSQ
jgi:hypothetical protein